MTAHSPLQSAQFAAPPAATDQPGRTAGPSDLTDTRVGPERTAESQPLASSLTSTFSDQGVTAVAIWESEGGPSVADPPELSDQGTRGGGGLPVGLDWSAFSARFFPGRRRHDLEALRAYGAYRNLSESDTN
jgi:hypothetical protein